MLLHNWLLHRSGSHHTASPRRALSACWMAGRTLATLTGARFPLVFGEEQPADVGMPFLRSVKDENARR